jgi:hypothetical protein
MIKDAIVMLARVGQGFIFAVFRSNRFEVG